MVSAAAISDTAPQAAGRKRHMIVDTIGLLLVVTVTSASVQDRDGARPALAHLRDLIASISLVRADGGYAGRLVTWAKKKHRPAGRAGRSPTWQGTTLDGLLLNPVKPAKHEDSADKLASCGKPGPSPPLRRFPATETARQTSRRSAWLAP